MQGLDGGIGLSTVEEAERGRAVVENVKVQSWWRPDGAREQDSVSGDENEMVAVRQ